MTSPTSTTRPERRWPRPSRTAEGALCPLGRQPAVEYGPTSGSTCRVAATVARRFGVPEGVASSVAFLASADASRVTGANLVVDGGWSVMKESS
ncbi:SDR family oxidoreductase [Streptomyces sp. NPDC088124]|uniref:SDR family oxidoreductase n=1 Tax=Streptomyces sp. NPDC088124 TaxID=3154654 RepID=UPI003422EC61